MDTRSLWKAITPDLMAYPSLLTTLEIDIAIIGGGITGVTTAYELTNKGYTVVLLEAGKIGESTTGYSTGNLYIPVQKSYTTLSSHFNQGQIKKIIQSRQDAINYIEKTVNNNNIKCDFFKRPSYLYTNNKENINDLEKEVNILKNAGIEINECNESDIPFKCIKASVIPNQAKFNPLAYIKALAKIVVDKGGRIFENASALSVEKKGERFVILTEKGSVFAKYVVMATHVPKGISLSGILSPAYRSYAVAFSTKNNDYSSGRYADWDEPHFVTSSHASKAGGPIDCLVVSGSHHRVGIGDGVDHIKVLENFIQQHFDVDSIYHRWSAQHYQSSDGLPYIGEVKKNYYLATGFYADGLVYGTFFGQLICNLIEGKSNPLAEIYSPKRHHLLSSAATLIKETFNLASQFIQDFPGNVEAHHFKDIANAQGKTLEIEGEKIGAYRDEMGHLHVVSAVCPHMKCLVKWNSFEKTWDCPCHGSRFNQEGVVLEGPAYHNLIKIIVKDK